MTHPNAHSPKTQPHSAEHFGDWRDHWWDPAYVALVIQSLGLKSCTRVLDVGCGVGHWGRVLLPHLPEARLIGIDRESEWVKKATTKAEALGLAARASYLEGDASAMPFPEDEFELVTCQTVLMHVPDPAAVLREMLRVAKPGACILAVEPNNMTATQIVGNTRFSESIETRMALTEFQLRCERGKAAVGEGNNSIGDILPGMFASLGLRDVSVRLNTRCSPLIPPYNTPAQRALRDQMIDWAQRGWWTGDPEKARRYYSAGGGRADDFERLWTLADEACRGEAEGLKEGTFHLAGGNVSYLIAGWK